MGRPPLEKKQRQLAVALPEETRSHLEKAAAASGQSIAEEIRRRIDTTIASEAIDPVTRELRDGLLNIAALLRSDFAADWHTSWWAHKAFVAAIIQRLAEYQPPERQSAAVNALFDPPETIGRLRERDDRRTHDYPQLKAAQQRKGRRLSARHIKAKRGDDND